MKNEENKLLYSVVILRTDGEHIIVLETDDYDKCFEKWNDLQTQWQTAHTEQKPFVLKEPVITAFHPVLIKEITVRPVTKNTVSKYDNPYMKQMVKNGFSETFNKFTGSNVDILDEGYK